MKVKYKIKEYIFKKFFPDEYSINRNIAFSTSIDINANNDRVLYDTMSIVIEYETPFGINDKEFVKQSKEIYLKGELYRILRPMLEEEKYKSPDNYRDCIQYRLHVLKKV